MFAITLKINNAYYSNQMVPFIIYGPYGYGKSSLSIKVLGEVYGTYDDKGMCIAPNYDWEMLKDHIFFHPRDFLDKLLSLIAQNKREKCIVWDDAGFWLNSLMWNDTFVKSVARYLDVARTNFGSIIFTSPSPVGIIKKVRGMPSLLTVKIEKRDDDNGNYAKHSRVGVGYSWWMLPDMKRSGVKPIFRDNFSCMLPDEIYNAYKKMRSQYTEEAVIMMKKELDEMEKGKLFAEVPKTDVEIR